ncbi:twin-arginine translocation signal domain-containing protein [Lentzea sp. NEAU-D13]|uniref:Twin-arginine translocation signal domain-containing protein n=1 Tax=Lentzea alba TaxID=2714351 RepID=A0A7C9RWY1_9PSEU|nr:twin-arginine translocation signal domain-containing protein [Lentzea alba]
MSDGTRTSDNDGGTGSGLSRRGFLGRAAVASASVTVLGQAGPQRRQPARTGKERTWST